MLLGFCLFGLGVIHGLDRLHRLCTKAKIANGNLWTAYTSTSVGTRPSLTAPSNRKSQTLTHESSSVGARPSSAAPVQQNHLDFTTQISALFLQFRCSSFFNQSLTLKAAGVQPEALSSTWFCWTGAAGDDRAPTEERSCVPSRDFCSTGRSRKDAFRQKCLCRRSTNCHLRFSLFVQSRLHRLKKP
jgi:hypothetical protein